MRISIFGLGYVGSVSAGCLSRMGHDVVGIDVSLDKVELVRKGGCPVAEPGLDALFSAAVQSGKLTAATDPEEAVRMTDLSLVCVGTPSNANGSLNLDHVFAVAEQIGRALKTKPGRHFVAIRSTSLPGTVENVERIIARISSKRAGVDFDVASNPEFLREGTAVRDFESPPYTIVGATGEHLISVLRSLYAGIAAPFHVLKPREAEILKYFCNTFHALKVVFANEAGVVAKAFGVDSHVVMDLLCADTKLNISPAYLKPGFAFGGSCLPKDVRAIAHAGRAQDLDTPLLESITRSNAAHIKRVVDRILESGKKRVGVLGLSFKNGTDDLRESPTVQVVEILVGKGLTVSIYDPAVHLGRLIGANKLFIEREVPHFSSLMKSSLEEVMKISDIVVITNATAEFRTALPLLRKDQLLFDLVRIVENPEDLAGSYVGIAW